MKSSQNNISGYNAILAYLSRGSSEALLYVDGAKADRNERIAELERIAHATGVTVRRVSAQEILRLSGGGGAGGQAASAVLAIPGSEETTREGDRLSAYLDRIGRSGEEATNHLVLVLDGITDPQNLGAILRSADMFGVELVVLPSRRAARETETVARVSAGASAFVEIAEVANLVRAMKSLKTAGFWIYGADMHGERADSRRLSGKTALVLGNEGAGISRLVRETCDLFVSIPTAGHVDSLNVSVSAGILLYEIRRQWS